MTANMRSRTAPRLYFAALSTSERPFGAKPSMARITVEDCLARIPNRFQLVLAATYRARMLSQGHAAKVEAKNKPGVTALREVAAVVF